MENCSLCCSDGGNIIWQDDICRIVFADEKDYPGFCRVITNQHVKEMTDLPKTKQLHIMQIVLHIEKAMREILQPDKINLASLGNQVPHVHWHIIPRYINDKHFPAPIWTTAHMGRQPKHHTPDILAALAERITSMECL